MAENQCGTTRPAHGKSLWAVLTYQLISPAILGSMIFELFEKCRLENFLKYAFRPERLDFLDVTVFKTFVLQLLIVTLYCMSWVYASHQKNRERKEIKGKQLLVLLDLAAAILFPIALRFAGDPNFPGVTARSLGTISLLYTLHQFVRNEGAERYFGMRLGLFAAFSFFGVSLIPCGSCFEIPVLLMITLSFAIFLALFHPNRKTRKTTPTDTTKPSVAEGA